MSILYVGIDLAKNVFAVHGVNALGVAELRQPKVCAPSQGRNAGVLPRAVLALPPLQTVKLLEQVRERIRYLHYSPRTEHVYVYWIRLFIRFHKLRHQRELGAPEASWHRLELTHWT